MCRVLRAVFCLAFCGTALLLAGRSSVSAGEVAERTDAETGWSVFSLQHESTVAELTPEAGCNLFSIRVDGVQYLRVPEQLERLRGVAFGTPILYPSPNRVRGARFRFQGQEFRFPPNNGENFIHGLVHSVAWQVRESGSSQDQAWLLAETSFDAQRTEFPLAHKLRVKITVADRRVRWDYDVDNHLGTSAIPFGFGLHPYFLYQGSRAETYLQVPASHWMESEQLLPTGRLVSLAGTSYDLRQPTSLAERDLDDVFFGMSTDQPASVEFRDVGRRITFHASPEFTHLVVYTPDRPFFCVENQTCSTDAHNLANSDRNDVAHLFVCPPGESRTGWVEYRFGK